MCTNSLKYRPVIQQQIYRVFKEKFLCTGGMSSNRSCWTKRLPNNRDVKYIRKVTALRDDVDSRNRGREKERAREKEKMRKYTQRTYRSRIGKKKKRKQETEGKWTERKREKTCTVGREWKKSVRMRERVIISPYRLGRIRGSNDPFIIRVNLQSKRTPFSKHVFTCR